MIEGHSQTHDGLNDSNDRKASLYALAIIIDDLKNDDPQCRLNGISKLPTVALAIGPERTRSELLMFLKEATNDEDEILLSIAGQMGSFLPFIGGVQYVSHLIPILESIMCVEESICREEAVKSMNILIEQMSVDQVNDLIVPLFEKYYQNEMFTIKSSLCCLFLETYGKLEKMDIKEKLCAMYKEMCADDAPITRRAAASKMKEIIPILCFEHIENEIAPAFLTLLNDDQDSVRVAAADAFPEIIGSVKPNEKLTNILLTELSKLFRDKSWRIRYRVAGSIACFHGMVDEDFIINSLLPAYVSFLKDDEPEVRTNAAHQLYDFCETLPPNLVTNILLTKLIPCIKILSDDINVNVKSAVATVLLRLSDFLDKNETVNILIPLFNAMLKDSVADVRLNVLTNLENINRVIEAGELCNTLLPTIIELADDSKWRVRLAVIEYIPSLAKQFGINFFDTKLISLCVSWLTDTVFSIRDAAGKVLGELVDCFGVDWAQRHLLQKLIELASDVNYLRRMTCLFTINHLTKLDRFILLVPKLLSLVLKLTNDRIPNVRFNAALTLQYIGLVLPPNDQTLEDTIIPKLNEMTADDDVDVRSFSMKAIDTINSHLSLTNASTTLSH